MTNIAPQGRILEILLEHCGSFVPAATFTGSAGVSQAELVPLIASLQRQGISLSVSSADGYRLNALPDRLVPPLIQQGLKTARAAREIHYFAQIDSTNRIAKEMAAQGAAEGTLVIAEEQTGGRGRMDRTWVSDPFSSILCSIIFYPGLGPSSLFRLTMMASVAVVRAIQVVCKIPAQIKWPNDVYIENKKVCGILTEFAAESDRVQYAVVGIGINVNDEFRSAPELAGIATSLKNECGRTISRRALLQQLLEELDRRYETLLQGSVIELKTLWEHHSMILNRKVSIASAQDLMEGTARGITDDGHLLLEDVSGTIREIVSGDVSLKL